MLNRSDLNIPELNLTNPLYFGKLRNFRDRKNIDFDVYLPTIGVNLQRGLVWTLQQKQQLILSVFKQRFGSYSGVRLIQHFSAVYDNEKELFQIIDGKQRLTTLFDFYDGKFPINFKGKEYYFSNLSKDLQEAVAGFNMEFVIKYHYDDDPVTDQDKIDWFEMINFFGTPQEMEHLNKLKRGGEYVDR